MNFGSHPGTAAPQCGNYDDALVAAKTKAALGCGGPRGDLPLIHLMVSPRTAILTMAVGGEELAALPYCGPADTRA